jgi:hypothetical protein
MGLCRALAYPVLHKQGSIVVAHNSSSFDYGLEFGRLCNKPVVLVDARKGRQVATSIGAHMGMTAVRVLPGRARQGSISIMHAHLQHTGVWGLSAACHNRARHGL